MKKYQKNLYKVIKKILIVTVFAAGFFPNNITAKQTAKGAKTNAITETDMKGNTWAVIVGISKYQNVPGLNYADKDAIAFYDYLVNKKGIDSTHIQLLVNDKAIASDIYGALDWLNLSVKENDRVIFYFSGHGDVETKTIHQNGFLLANDAPVAAYMTKGTVSVSYLQDYLETYVAKKKVKDVLLLVDACRAGKLAGGSEGIQITMHALGETWNNQIIKILSAQEGEASFEDKKWGGGRGVFSYYLVKGLEGLANRNADSVINTAEIAAYLPFAVADETGSKQNPTVSGNPKNNLFSFDKNLLAIANLKDLENNTDLVLASRGNAEDIDPEIKKWYEQYRTYLQKGRLIWGEKPTDTLNCAKYYYLKLVNDARAKKLYPSVYSSFLSSLQHKTEVKLGDYIKGKSSGNGIDDPENEAYKEIVYAKSLVDTSYILYNYYSARIYFMEGSMEKDDKKAIILLKKTIQIEPDASYAYNRLGNKFENLFLNSPENKLADSAIFYFEKAILYSPNWYRSIHELGLLYSYQGQYKNAIKNTERAIDLALKQDHSLEVLGSYFNLFQYYNENNEPKKADSALNRGIYLAEMRIKKDSTQTLPGYYYRNLGELYVLKKDFLNAVNCYKKAIAADGKDIGAYNELADVYKDNIKNIEESIKYFKQAIVIDPADEYGYNYYSNLIDAYLQKKDFDAALKLSDEYLKLFPKKAESYEYKGQIYLNIKNRTKASAYFKKAIDIDPLNIHTYKSIADICYAQKDYINYANYNLATIKLAPDNQYSYYNIACGYSLSKDLKNSIKYLELALKKGYNDFSNVNTDTDLTNIRQLPEFKALLKKYFPDQVK